MLTAIKYTPLAVPKLTDDTEGGAARGNHTQPTFPELANDTAGATRGGGSCSSGEKGFHSSQREERGKEHTYET